PAGIGGPGQTLLWTAQCGLLFRGRPPALSGAAEGSFGRSGHWPERGDPSFRKKIPAPFPAPRQWPEDTPATGPGHGPAEYGSGADPGGRIFPVDLCGPLDAVVPWDPRGDVLCGDPTYRKECGFPKNLVPPLGLQGHGQDRL